MLLGRSGTCSGVRYNGEGGWEDIGVEPGTARSMESLPPLVLFVLRGDVPIALLSPCVGDRLSPMFV